VWGSGGEGVEGRVHAHYGVDDDVWHQSAADRAGARGCARPHSDRRYKATSRA
jgi:hypothetical protein